MGNVKQKTKLSKALGYVMQTEVGDRVYYCGRF